MSDDLPYVSEPSPAVQCLHWRQEAHESPSAPRTRVGASAPVSGAPELLEGGAR
jgi:hypothetical protein